MSDLTTRKFIPFGGELVNRDYVVKFGKVISDIGHRYRISLDMLGGIELREYFESEDEQNKRFKGLCRIFGVTQ